MQTKADVFPLPVHAVSFPERVTTCHNMAHERKMWGEAKCELEGVGGGHRKKKPNWCQSHLHSLAVGYEGAGLIPSVVQTAPPHQMVFAFNKVLLRGEGVERRDTICTGKACVHTRAHRQPHRAACPALVTSWWEKSS